MRRLIFTLLYDCGKFMLSRNFRLQQVGDVNWLFRNYDFANVSRGLDELMVLNVSRGARDSDKFTEAVQHIAGQCFIPLTVGGGISSFELAQNYMRSGADKLLINSAFESDPALVAKLANHFGQQCIVAGVDFRTDAAYRRTVFAHNATQAIPGTLSDWVLFLQETGAGEILFQSIDRDGTGMGLDLSVVTGLETRPEVPCILMGGVGKAEHIVAGLSCESVDAVATANLFNFIGTAFIDTRKAILASGIEVATWEASAYEPLHDIFAHSQIVPDAA